MHRIFFIREILLEIFGHCFSIDQSCADLAVLARTCRTFKEPALDILWEDLPDLSPLARCLPEVCCKVSTHYLQWDYSLSRLLNEAEWNILRGYTRRVRHIRGIGYLDDSAMRVLASFTDPLFPNLRTFETFYPNCTLLPVVCPAVPSLTSLHLDLRESPDDIPSLTKFVETIGKFCPNMMHLGVVYYPGAGIPPSEPFGASVSRQLRRWTSLEDIDCPRVILNAATILDLPSTSTLTSLSFTLNGDVDNQITQLGSALVFPNLVDLKISSASLRSVASLFSRIQLPKIEGLSIEVSRYTPSRDIQECWHAVQKACPSNTLARLEFWGLDDRINDLPEEVWFTSDDLLPYKGFGNLRKMNIEVGWSRVNLTDEDILGLASMLPRLEELVINVSSGWRLYEVRKDGGVTLSGLLQILRQCPSLHKISIVIDFSTFSQIPPWLDMSFPPRESLVLDYLDSYESELGEDTMDVFEELGLEIWSSHIDI